MDGLRDELADLVAAFQAHVDALGAGGTVVLPAAPSAAPAPEPRRERTPTPARVEEEAAPPRAAPAAAAPPPAAPAPPSPVPAAGEALLGAWSRFLVDPAEELERTCAAFGAACPSCGAPAPRGEGSTRPRLFLVGSPATGAAGDMLAAMLVKVLAIEPTDTYRVSPVGCGTCRQQVGAIARALRARVILGLGADARAMLAAPPGEWAAWEGAEVLGSYHPAEMIADRGLKRPAFEHLQGLAQRLAR